MSELLTRSRAALRVVMTNAAGKEKSGHAVPFALRSKGRAAGSGAGSTRGKLRRPGPGFGQPIPVFHFFPGPRSFSEELQTGADAGLVGEAPDPDGPPHFLPAVDGHQLAKHHLQRDAMQGVLRSGVSRGSSFRPMVFVIGRHDFPDTVVPGDHRLKLRLPGSFPEYRLQAKRPLGGGSVYVGRASCPTPMRIDITLSGIPPSHEASAGQETPTYSDGPVLAN